MIKRPLLLFSLSACLAVAAGGNAGSLAADSQGQTGLRSQMLLSEANKAASKTSGKQALSTASNSTSAPAYDGAPVLDPSAYFGGAAMGYAAAKAAPQVMSHLFCYCGCDATDHHRHLIDCFTSDHGVDCHICQEEAVLGLKLFREGLPLAEIQKQVDEKYSQQYPFKEETASLKQYKSSRLYKPSQPDAQTESASAGGSGQDHGAAKQAACTTEGAGTTTATGPKLKPGFHVGNCCHDSKN